MLDVHHRSRCQHAVRTGTTALYGAMLWAHAGNCPCKPFLVQATQSISSNHNHNPCWQSDLCPCCQYPSLLTFKTWRKSTNRCAAGKHSAQVTPATMNAMLSRLWSSHSLGLNVWLTGASSPTGSTLRRQGPASLPSPECMHTHRPKKGGRSCPSCMHIQYIAAMLSASTSLTQYIYTHMHMHTHTHTQTHACTQ